MKDKQEHHVGITNSQKNNPDADIANMTRCMDELFANEQYAEAACVALRITAKSKEELRAIFERNGITVLHIDHEAFGIFEGSIEPTYDLQVDGPTASVIMAAREFGKCHAQQAVLIARKIREREMDPAEKLSITLNLHTVITPEEAVGIAKIVQAHDFRGATFLPKKGAVIIHHTDDLRMTKERFNTLIGCLITDLKNQGYSLTTMLSRSILFTEYL